MMVNQNIENSISQLSKDWEHDPAYYDNADSWVDKFWAKDTVFRRFFDRMNSDRILEIACGRGRHANQMRDWSNQKTIMDLVQTNIDFCENRFKDYLSINIVKGNGKDLSFSEANKFSSVYCYDAMVHFDHTIVYNYLLEIARVLEPGGMAVLHHSNYSENPGGDYKNNPNWRAFMPNGLFVDYCAKSNLQVSEQAVISWGDFKSCDMVSLVLKPE